MAINGIDAYHAFLYALKPMTPQVSLPPAFPVFFDYSSPPLPSSSGFA